MLAYDGHRCLNLLLHILTVLFFHITPGKCRVSCDNLIRCTAIVETTWSAKSGYYQILVTKSDLDLPEASLMSVESNLSHLLARKTRVKAVEQRMFTAWMFLA